MLCAYCEALLLFCVFFCIALGQTAYFGAFHRVVSSVLLVVFIFYYSYVLVVFIVLSFFVFMVVFSYGACCFCGCVVEV